MRKALIALGANLGDRLATMRTARDALGALAGTELLASSAVYETEPVGPPQPRYLNAVVELRTSLSPRELLAALLAIEARLGRVRDGRREQPRTLDLDLLWVEGVRSDDPELTLPHPRLAQRSFVLAPLCDVEPDLPLDGGTPRQLLAARPAAERAGIVRGDEL